MALQFANENLVIVVAGCSGSGKSTFANCYLLNAKLTCRFIFDPSGEYAIRFQRRPATNAAELNASIVTGWVIFDPHTMFPGDPVTAFAKFCEWSWTMSRSLSGQKILFADEIWKFCNPNKIPLPLASIVQDGRKNGIGLLATTQRPNRMNEAIIGEATEFVGFRLVGTNKLDYLERNLDEFPVSELPQLLLADKAKSHFIAQNLRTGGLRRYELDFKTGKTRRLSR
jgi:DNA helicase HerA-like ATPase